MELDNLNRDQLQAGLQAVLALHKPEDDGLGGLVCDHCDDMFFEMWSGEHPCPTRKAAESAITELGGVVDDLE